MLRGFPLYNFIYFLGLGDKFMKNELIKREGMEDLFPLVIQMLVLVVSPLDMAPFCIIIS